MFMSSQGAALVQLALDALGCNQKELASRLGVSPTQITKWKKGDYMSHDMEMRLRDYAQIGQHLPPELVLLTGSAKAAGQWERLIGYLAYLAVEDTETGYNTPPLTDDLTLLYWTTFDTLLKMGVQIPPFPEELDVDYEDMSDEEFEVFFDNPYVNLIHRIYKSFTDVYGFYAAYIYDVVWDEELDLMSDVGAKIDDLLLKLAATKLEEEEVASLAPRFREFRHEINNQYIEWLNLVKDRAYRAGIPLQAEFLDLVYQSHDVLGHDAEYKSLGLSSFRLHPDIYMNELLQGMRVIHQVLPAILDKLGIDDFKLDESDLWVGRH